MRGLNPNSVRRRVIKFTFKAKKYTTAFSKHCSLVCSLNSGSRLAVSYEILCVRLSFVVIDRWRWYPGYQRFFLTCDEELRLADTSSAEETSGEAGHFLRLF